MFSGKSEQVHVALLALTESESFDYCSWSGTIRSEWRKSAELLSDKSWFQIGALQNLPATLEKWEELVRRYERSKSSGTTTAALDEDIKTASLEAFVPIEL